jgi:type 1 glutamine amidotransferase
MKSPFRLLLMVAAGCALAFNSAVHAAEAGAPAKKKILFFSKSSGFEHEAIKLQLKDGKEGYGFPVLRELGKQNNIEFTFSKDGSLFTPEYLAQFDAYFFYTTGDLTVPRSDPRGDGLPPMTKEGKAALLAAVASGKGFLGTHSATDSFHSFGRNLHVPERFNDDGDKADDYIKMLGGEFIRHGAQQKSQVIVADAKFPGVSAIPANWAPMEEWYSLKNFAPDMHVILVQDTTGMTGAEYQRGNYPTTWIRMHGKGRVFYTSLGHREDIWNHPAFQALLTGALNWSLGRVDADVTPNLDKAAPKAKVNPAYGAPPAPAPKAAPKKDAKETK